MHAIELDVTDRDGFARAADEAERVFGNVHVLCNNAGMGILGPVTLARYDDWDWGLGVLLGGAVNGIQTFVPRHARARRGRPHRQHRRRWRACSRSPAPRSTSRPRPR